MMKSEIQEEYFKDYTENPTHKTKKILILISSVRSHLGLDRRTRKQSPAI